MCLTDACFCVRMAVSLMMKEVVKVVLWRFLMEG